MTNKDKDIVERLQTNWIDTHLFDECILDLVVTKAEIIHLRQQVKDRDAEIEMHQGELKRANALIKEVYGSIKGKPNDK